MTNGLRFLPLGIVLLAIGFPTPSVLAATPGTLWVAPCGPGQSLRAAQDTGARIRDAFPEALVLDDAASASTLAAAGWRVRGPFFVPDEAGVYLLRAREAAAPAPRLAEAVHDLPEVVVLWTDGSRFLVRADSGLPPTLPGRLVGQALATDRREEPFDHSGLRPPSDFGAWVDAIVGEVTPTAYFQWIERLAGAEPVVVGGEDVTFATRYTRAAQCRTAEQYVFEQFQAMGFTDVEYDTFNVGGTLARNVIATLPGTETPDRIYILCGHLDSTSPVPYSSAPGANDNASGTAAVLAGAEIMKDYSFRSTLKFIAFTGEEQGLVGSEHYAAAAQAAGDSILAVVNCDMIAYFDTHYQIDIESSAYAEWLMLTLDDATATYTGLDTQLLYNPWGSDHVPFLQRGFPAVLAIESDYFAYPCYHETCDTADRNNAEFGAEVTRACLATVAYLAGAHDAATGVAAVGPVVSDLVVQPNPFRSGTDIVFAVTEPGRVTVTVHDIRGALVRTISDRHRSAATYRQPWDGRSGAGRPMPAGVYFVTVHGDRLDQVRKVVRVQ